MPPTRGAALVTDAYRRRLVGLRDGTADQVVALLADVDLDTRPAQLAQQLERWRVRAAALTTSAGARAAEQAILYLSAYLMAAGGDPLTAAVEPPRPIAPTLVVARSALLWRLGQGAGRAVAVQTAEAMARRVTRDAVGLTAQAALTEGIRREPQIDGWHRVTSGSACKRCAGLAGTRYRDDDDFDHAHPACRCTPEPTVLGRAEALRRQAPAVVSR